MPMSAAAVHRANLHNLVFGFRPDQEFTISSKILTAQLFIFFRHFAHPLHAIEKIIVALPPNQLHHPLPPKDGLPTHCPCLFPLDSAALRPKKDGSRIQGEGKLFQGWFANPPFSLSRRTKSSGTPIPICSPPRTSLIVCFSLSKRGLFVRQASSWAKRRSKKAHSVKNRTGSLGFCALTSLNASHLKEPQIYGSRITTSGSKVFTCPAISPASPTERTAFPSAANSSARSSQVRGMLR